MINGKIISIKYEGEDHWILILDGHRRKFKRFGEVGVYLKKCLDHGKDQGKVKLLQRDYDMLFK